MTKKTEKPAEAEEYALFYAPDSNVAVLTREDLLTEVGPFWDWLRRAKEEGA